MKKVIAILFLLSGTLSFSQVEPPMPAEEKPQRTDRVYDFPDVSPEFPGGQGAMMKFIRETIEYPKYALENDEDGKVYVKFIVRKDGSITDVTVERGEYESLNNEALRIMSKMPKWIPGKMKDKDVDSIARLPLMFTKS